MKKFEFPKLNVLDVETDDIIQVSPDTDDTFNDSDTGEW